MNHYDYNGDALSLLWFAKILMRRPAVRATLLLVPLLGLHYLVIPFRPPKKHAWEQFYEVLSAITASFQVSTSKPLSCLATRGLIHRKLIKSEIKVAIDARTIVRYREPLRELKKSETYRKTLYAYGYSIRVYSIVVPYSPLIQTFRGTFVTVKLISVAPWYLFFVQRKKKNARVKDIRK